jgi:hypothetical protein
MNGKYRAVYELFMKVLSKSYAQTYRIEVVVLIGGERSDSPFPRRGVMSATLLILILISGGAIAFFLRFLAALHKEIQSLRTHHVNMRSGVRMENTLKHRSFDRRASTIVRLEYRINDSRTLPDRLVRDGEVHPGGVVYTDSESCASDIDPEVRFQSSPLNLRIPRGGIYG